MLFCISFNVGSGMHQLAFHELGSRLVGSQQHFQIPVRQLAAGPQQLSALWGQGLGTKLAAVGMHDRDQFLVHGPAVAGPR